MDPGTIGAPPPAARGRSRSWSTGRSTGRYGRRTRLVALAGAAVLALASTPASATANTDSLTGAKIEIDVLSSLPGEVSGGDARVRVRFGAEVDPAALRVELNGAEVTARLAPDAGSRSRSGVLDGLRLGPNTLRATAPDSPTAEVVLTNHPISGPVFSGPQQYPFLCRTEQAGLGQPLVDNSDGQGMRVFALDETGAKTTTVVGWSRDCAAPTTLDYLYRATNGTFKPLPADGSRPADLTTTTTLDGRTVDYVVRRERGTINRFIYSIAMLAPLAEAATGGGLANPDDSAWNGRVVYRFDGGVAIGHDQGRLPGGALYHEGLSLGYAILYSTGTRAATHYNLVVGGETALMVKEHFIEGHGVPRYTVGVGGSGGAIQQYVYGQNYGSRVIDAAIPQYSYPDMVTQTIHIGDCELLEYYMDVTDRANPKWRSWPNRTWLIGLNASASVANPYTGTAGSTECIRGWRGLTPLAMNPMWQSPDPLWSIMDPPGVMLTVKWTHWDDLRNIYGVGPNGYARVPWDNAGVQYGLQAMRDGHLTPAEFLDLNAKVGSWKESSEMVQEGCPFVPSTCTDPAQFDPWSSRNIRLSPDGGATPAPRRSGDRQAIAAAYESGIVFDGDIDIPVIDWRHYLEHELDMHNSHQSFASRQRMLNFDGKAGNHVIWFTDARPARASDQTPQALAVIDQWLANLAANPKLGVEGSKPALATDRCFTTTGTEIASGPHVWAGILDNQPAGPCTAYFKLYSTSRIVAGGPIEGGIFACDRQSVTAAVARGVYGSWQPSAAERQRLEQIFPTGVCDYTKRDAGRP
ncbi:MAG TPA: DUF6351 family protein [Micromonosporaceae bacterium]|nr:DUF6351 family protein [Micromonosporaceae bacterium]